MSKFAKNKRNKSVALILLVILALAYFFAPDDILGLFGFEAKPSPGSTQGSLVVYALDVGQGDSFLLCSPNGKTMLIDTGEFAFFSVIENKLKSLDIKKLDVVVATHPHSDHIGSMAKVIQTYDIGAFYLPDATHTSATFEKMIAALEKKDVPVFQAKAITEIPWDETVTVSIVSPLADGEYDDLNDVSAMLHVSYFDTSMLFTGDAETPAEKQLLESLNTSKLKATVLKLGHHGSSTSTSEEFLQAVNPKYAIASLGADNSYGHPHRETLELLKKYNIPLYRTDTMGTITLVLDGQNVTITTEKAA